MAGSIDEAVAAHGKSLDEATAQRDTAIHYVAALLRILDKHGGYTTAEQQATMRGARALLSEVGR